MVRRRSQAASSRVPTPAPKRGARLASRTGCDDSHGAIARRLGQPPWAQSFQLTDPRLQRSDQLLVGGRLAIHTLGSVLGGLGLLVGSHVLGGRGGLHRGLNPSLGRSEHAAAGGSRSRPAKSEAKEPLLASHSPPKRVALGKGNGPFPRNVGQVEGPSPSALPREVSKATLTTVSRTRLSPSPSTSPRITSTTGSSLGNATKKPPARTLTNTPCASRAVLFVARQNEEKAMGE